MDVIFWSSCPCQPLSPYGLALGPSPFSTPSRCLITCVQSGTQCLSLPLVSLPPVLTSLLEIRNCTGAGPLGARMGAPGLVIARDSPEPPLPADSPFPEHPTSSETKAKNAEGPLGRVTASGWAPGITTGMSGSWRVARTCPCGCPWGVGGGKEWALSREPPWEVLSPTKRMVSPSTPQPSFCIRKLFWLSLPGMGQEPDLKC